jgi:hypothetical protein
MSNPSSATILQYWHHNLWRSSLNKLFIPKQDNFQFIEINDVIFQQSSSEQWVAPFVGKKENEEVYWIPFWIPCSSNQLPWMAPAHFEALIGQSPFSEQLHAFDDWCRFEWLTEEGSLIFDDWAKALKACKSLFDKLSDNQWQERLKALGFSLIDKAVVINVFPNQSNQTKLLKAYASYEECETSSELGGSELIEKAKTLCGHISAAQALTEQELKSAVHALNLEEGQLLAIKAPIGSNKEKWLSTVLASMVVNAALKNQNIASIYAVKKCGIYQYQVQAKLSEQNHTLQEIYGTFLQGLKIAVELSNLQESIEENDIDIDETQETIIFLQQQDEEFEHQLGQLLKLQSEFIKKTTRRSFWSWLLPQPKLNTQDLKYFTHGLGEENLINQESISKFIIDKMRHLKVQRTKIHQQLVENVEITASVRGTKERWLTWLKENVSASYQSHNIISDVAYVQAHFGEKLYALVVTTMGTWQKVEQIKQGDLLIIEDANRLLPQEIVPMLAEVKTAIFLGDNQDISACASMSAMPEEWDLKAHGLEDEECIEQLQYKGMLASTGNAFSVALANCAYQQLLEHGIYSANLSLSEHTVHELQYHTIQATGFCEHKGNALINLGEATAIVKWMISGPLSKALNETVIVTLFPLQKEIILQQLQAHGLACEVMTCYELPNRQWLNVVFSPVYTQKDSRPFIFDQGEHLLYSIIARAINNLWIIGDLGIFDSKMHSPSGHLAKRLFMKNKEEVVAVLD